MSDSRLDDLTRLGLVEVRAVPVVPVCYGWPTCAVCGCVTPPATAAAGLGVGEMLCPDCGSQLKAWAARILARAAERRPTLAEVNACTCGGVDGLWIEGTPRCEVCQAWEEQLRAQRRVYRERA